MTALCWVVFAFVAIIKVAPGTAQLEYAISNNSSYDYAGDYTDLLAGDLNANIQFWVCKFIEHGCLDNDCLKHHYYHYCTSGSPGSCAYDGVETMWASDYPTCCHGAGAKYFQKRDGASYCQSEVQTCTFCTPTNAWKG